eukprot:1067050-Pyramimonas_sp.AAC.1
MELLLINGVLALLIRELRDGVACLYALTRGHFMPIHVGGHAFETCHGAARVSLNSSCEYALK